MPDSLTLQTVLDAVEALAADVADLRAEQRVVSLEVRAGFAELKNDVQGVRHEVLEVRTRLTTLFDELAAFRREYNEHGHGRVDPDDV